MDDDLSDGSLMNCDAYTVFVIRQTLEKKPAECVEIHPYCLTFLHWMTLRSMLISRPLTGHITPTSRRRQKDRSSLRSHVEIS